MDNVAIVSGGMDSVVMLHHHTNQIGHVLNFIYGSKHNERETQFAELHAVALGKTFKRIDMSFLGDVLKSDLLKSGGDIPEGHYEDQSMKRTVVPFRNGIMLSIAIGYCETMGGNSVFIGNHSGDHAIYPDCRANFILYMGHAAFCGTYKQIGIKSPFLTFSKREIAEMGKVLNVDFSKTYTCYKGGEKHCGKCGACTERKEALLGYDSTEYEE